MDKRAVNGAIARRIMGWTLTSSPGGGGGVTYWQNKDKKMVWIEADHSLMTQSEPWSPTTNMEHAGMLIDRLHDLGYIVDIESSKQNYDVYISDNALHARRWYKQAKRMSEGISLATMDLIKEVVAGHDNEPSYDPREFYL